MPHQCKNGPRLASGVCPRKPKLTARQIADEVVAVKHINFGTHYSGSLPPALSGRSTQGRGTVEFHRVHPDAEGRPGEILASDGPKLGLPTEATMIKLIKQGLRQPIRFNIAPHQIRGAMRKIDFGGEFEAIVDRSDTFHGWTRIGS